MGSILKDAAGLPAPRDTTPEELIKSSLAAWKAMPKCLGQWAWYSRGYFNAEDLAKMRQLSGPAAPSSLEEVTQNVKNACTEEVMAVHKSFLLLEEPLPCKPKEQLGGLQQHAIYYAPMCASFMSHAFHGFPLPILGFG